MRGGMNGVRCLFLAVVLMVGCGESAELLDDAETDAATSNLSMYNCTVLNSGEDEFAPVVLADGNTVLFTSSRRKGGADARKLSPQFLYGEAVYQSARASQNVELNLQDRSAWMPVEPYHAGILDRVNTGAVHVDEARGSLYVSGTYVTMGEGGADLYALPYPEVGTGFTRIDNVNSPWWDAHPTVSADGGMLVFSSDRVAAPPTVSDSGSRAPHLWISKREGAGWSVPRQLPVPVNSDAAEISPVFGPDGYLYFATTRWIEAGFEIVRTQPVREGWSTPERLPAPVNSRSDDCFPFLMPDRRQMLLASNRPGGAGGYDIWCAEMPYCIAVTADVRQLDGDPAGRTSTQPAAQIAMEVIDPSTNSVVARGMTDDRGVYTSNVCLKAGARYMLRPGTRSCYVSLEGFTFDTPIPAALSDTVRMQVDLRRQALPEFHVVSDSIPFFVTGYWYPNTTSELARMRNRLTRVKDLPNANFIDTSDYDYDWAAARVDNWFGNLYDAIDRMLVPMLDSCYGGSDTLVISVLGYVDPRGLAWGKFDESDEVRTRTMTIRPGTVMQGEDGNEKLSHLRAHYAKTVIDAEMRQRSSRYSLLRGLGRLRMEATGGQIGYGKGGTTKGPVNDPLKRKFTVNVEIIAGK